MALATFPHKVKTWSRWDPMFHLDKHDGVFPMPPSPVPYWGKAWHFAASFLWASEYSGDPHDNEKRVLADGAFMVSREATVGAGVILPHFNVLPLSLFFIPHFNLLIPLILLGSSSKCMFAASSVIGSDGPIACSALPYAGLNLACGDPCSRPTSLVITHGTVYVGFTVGDFFFGLAFMAIDSGIGWAFGQLAKGVMGKLGDKILKGFLRPGFNAVLRTLFSNSIGRKIFGGAYTKAFVKKGTKGFQSIADEYITAVIGTMIQNQTENASQAVTSDADNVPDSNPDSLSLSITKWMTGGAESF